MAIAVVMLSAAVPAAAQAPAEWCAKANEIVNTLSNMVPIEVDAVTAWLTANVDGAVAPFEFEVIAGGQGSATFTLAEPATINILVGTSDGMAVVTEVELAIER